VRQVPLAVLGTLLVSCGPRGNGPPPATAGVALEVIAPAALRDVVARERGKVVLVDFWATWCVPCVKGFPHTVELYRDYGPRGLSVISMSLDDPSERGRVLEFLKRVGATFPNYLSAAGGGTASVEALGIEGVPHYRIYDREGRVAKDFSVDPAAERQYAPEDIDREILQNLERP